MNSNNKKLTTEELNSLVKLQDDFVKLTAQLGQLAIERIALEQSLDENAAQSLQLKEQYISLKKVENTFQENLTSKYGHGSVNLETGEFITEV